MVARQTKFVTIVNLILGVLWFVFAISYLFFADDKLVLGLLYGVISIAYLTMSIYNMQNGFFRIENGEIVKREFLTKPKRIKIDEINWARCIGSYYTLKSPSNKMTIELSNVHNDDIPAFERILKDIVMSVPPYKRD